MGACSKEEKNFPIYIRPGKQTVFFFFFQDFVSYFKKSKKPKPQNPTWSTAEVKVIYVRILQKELI